MTADLVLLTIIAVCSVVCAVFVVIATVVIMRTSGAIKREMADRLAEAERELSMTMQEFRATARGLTDLSSSGKRLAEEISLGYLARRVGSGERTSSTSMVHTGLDIGLKLLDVWRVLRTSRERKEGKQ